jgi:hypothetical protein
MACALSAGKEFPYVFILETITLTAQTKGSNESAHEWPIRIFLYVIAQSLPR